MSILYFKEVTYIEIIAFTQQVHVYMYFQNAHVLLAVVFDLHSGGNPQIRSLKLAFFYEVTRGPRWILAIPDIAFPTSEAKKEKMCEEKSLLSFSEVCLYRDRLKISSL